MRDIRFYGKREVIKEKMGCKGEGLGGLGCYANAERCSLGGAGACRLGSTWAGSTVTSSCAKRAVSVAAAHILNCQINYCVLICRTASSQIHISSYFDRAYGRTVSLYERSRLIFHPLTHFKYLVWNRLSLAKAEYHPTWLQRLINKPRLLHHFLKPFPIK